MTSHHQQKHSFAGALVIANALRLMGRELWRGARSRSLPFPICSGIGVLVCALLITRVDAYAWRWLGVAWLYPFKPFLYWIYAAFWIGIGFWSWAVFRVALRRKLTRRLTETFVTAGLKTAGNRVPGFISDDPVDGYARKLLLHPVGLPVSQFEKSKPSLETGLQIYIDDIKEDRRKGTVGILYAHTPMDSKVAFKELKGVPTHSFAIGKARSGWMYAKLREVPHVLVAGFTNAGKSTFLRQVITSLYLHNSKANFSLIDLKGGLEFQLFDRLPRVQVYANVAQAIRALELACTELDQRIELLKSNRCKDIDALNEKPDSPKLSRRIIVIDEAAEVFLAGDLAGAKEAQTARRMASHIAAQGRAVGIHLIIATQRPDRSAIAPQTKANLQGRLCFQMADNASSMTILDSGRATDLPPIPGRAIWKNGLDLIEVQTPLLTSEEASSLLASFRRDPETTAETAPQLQLPEPALQNATEASSISQFLG